MEGLTEGFKQGWKGLKEGMKYFAGEVANVFTGSGAEEERALDRIKQMEAEGKTNAFATWRGNSYINPDGARVYVPDRVEREIWT